ncbi:hypothetical protein [Marinobacter shengliensis]|uniref:hypothetical protein n=1 Tax=Marinobacter shengliensis TaxID=1389223 RepID=UPI000D0E5BFF|nr:hypothetical protein [Marinobacter shengliensis]PSF11698.1 hypothetical protein C7H10_18490 [Marinobacter shengliensis]
MSRKHITQTTQADVVIKSKRRCALCVGLNDDLSEKPGQIAHLNGDNSDSRFENLVWLCLEHHDKFDSKTSQTKNYTSLEIRSYRDKLYQQYSNSNYTVDDVRQVREYLTKYAPVFEYVFHEYEELAFKIYDNMFEELTAIRDFWHTNTLRSFNPAVREIQDRIANSVVGICALYEIDKYDGVGNWIRFAGDRFPQQILVEKRREARMYVDEIANYWKQLQQIAEGNG